MNTPFAIGRRTTLMMLVFLGCGSGFVTGQERMSEERVKAFVARAEAMAAAGQIDQAARLAERLLQEQPPPGDPRLLFTLAWLHVEQAKAASAQEKTPHLNQASRRYLALLRQFPGHPQASENLAQVYIDLGQPRRALEILSRMTTDRLTPEQNYQRLIKMGDLAGSAGEDERAYALYQEAEALRPGDGLAPARLVALYPKLPPTSTDRFLAACERFALEGHPQWARRGYEAILQRAPKNPEIAERAQQALQRWLKLEAQARALSLESLNRLPSAADWNFSGLHELIRLVQNPSNATPDRLPYWTGTEPRRHILSIALQSLAYRDRLAGDLIRAEALYQSALGVCPNPGVYGANQDLKNEPIAKLDIALDLSALYNAHPELDPGERKFQELEEPLLMEKNAAYGERNLEAMQKYHTMFALIYAQTNRQRWTENSMRAAPYHLERAVTTARLIAQRDAEEFKPLPHLIKIHADGLAAQNRNPRKAHQLYLDAAQGYLDRDDLLEAEKVLNSANVLGKRLDLTPPPKQQGLKNILDLKSALRTSNPRELGEKSNHLLQELKAGRSPLVGATDGLDPKFVNRQTVRVLTDVSDKMYQSGRPEIAQELRVEAATRLETQPGATGGDLIKIMEIPAEIPRRDPANPKAVPPPSIDIRRVTPRAKEDQLLDPKSLPRISRELQINPVRK